MTQVTTFFHNQNAATLHVQNSRPCAAHQASKIRALLRNDTHHVRVNMISIARGHLQVVVVCRLHHGQRVDTRLYLVEYPRITQRLQLHLLRQTYRRAHLRPVFAKRLIGDRVSVRQPVASEYIITTLAMGNVACQPHTQIL